jgi:prepilin-type N-terminal cleavage/methylation domain-containing protein
MRRLLASHERGTTLIELLVTMILMGVVSTLVVVAVTQVQRVFTHTDDEERGLADAKVIFDRVARDVRESRGVMCDGLASDPTCAAHLQLWIDSNSDYVKQPSEIVTWRLEPDADGVHQDVYRLVGPAGPVQTKQLQASSLVVAAVFTYFNPIGGQVTCPASLVAPCSAQRVDVVLKYDAIKDRGAGERQAAVSARIRNKG